MKFVSFVAGVLISVFMMCCSAQARGPYGSISVVHWSGGAFTNDDTGAFNSCIASAPYASGITLHVIIGENYGWSLGFSNPSWQLNVGQIFPIVLTFDGQAPVNVSAKIIGISLVAVPMPDNSALIAQFRKAKAMSAFAQGTLFQFAMNGSAGLLPALINCVKKSKEFGIANAGEFASAPTKSAMAKSVETTAHEDAAPAKPAKSVSKSGTGFVVSNSGHVVTNHHVVNGCTGDILGNLGGDAQVKLRLVSSDEVNDLALLQAPGPFKEFATIRDKPTHSGESIVAIGYPYHGLLTSDFTVTTGIVSSLGGILNDTRYLQISAAVQPGNSGGPLLDAGGQVVGIVAMKLNAIKFAKVTGNIPENINFAIKTGALRDFLDNSVVPYQTGNSSNDLKTEDIAQKARAFTLFISCKATAPVESAKN